MLKLCTNVVQQPVRRFARFSFASAVINMTRTSSEKYVYSKCNAQRELCVESFNYLPSQVKLPARAVIRAIAEAWPRHNDRQPVVR